MSRMTDHDHGRGAQRRGLSMKAFRASIGAVFVVLAALVWAGEVTLWPLMGGLLCAEYGVRRIWQAFE